MPQLAAQLFAGDAKSMHSIISTENGSKDDSKSGNHAGEYVCLQTSDCPP